MATITTRSGKGSPLTNTEVDSNFTNLNTDKAETGSNSDITALSGITGGISEADYVDFDVDAGASGSVGRLKWNDTDGTLDISLKGGNATLQVGQESNQYVYNADSSTIANGELVYIYGASNGHIAVKKFISDNSIDPHLCLGMATESIASAGMGFITTYGMVRDIDTSSYDSGDPIFADPDTAGAFTDTRPSTPDTIVELGVVVESNVTTGSVFIHLAQVHESNEIIYDNSDSELVATNIKGALDELSTGKADVSLLSSNVTLFATSASSTITGYYKLVDSTSDSDFDDPAIDSSTGSLTDDTVTNLGKLTSAANVFSGDVGGITASVIGNVKRTAGNDTGEFRFKVYHRTSGGTETLMGTSGWTDGVTNAEYTQFLSSAYLSTKNFTSTDRVVLYFEGKLVDGSNGDSTFSFQYGGTEPVRALFPVSVSVVPTDHSAGGITTDTTAFGGILSGSNTTVQSALDAIDDHGHGISGITGLQTALNAKAATSSLGSLATINSVDSSKIDANAVGASELNVSGNGTSTQFLRSDGDGTFTWATPTDNNTTYTSGSGLTLSGTEFSHSDTSSQASSNNSAGTVIQDITLDTFGHITGLGTVNLDGRYYTETESDARFLKLSGGEMTGNLVLDQHTLTASGASVTVDFNQANDFIITMNSNTSLVFSNVNAGQTGIIYLKQDSTGGRTFTLPAIAKTPNGGATIAQETGADTISVLSYTVLDSSNVLINYIGDYA